MSEEEMNRKMEFIVEQQAQFVVDIQNLYESQQGIQKAQVEMTVKHNHLTDALTTVVGMVGKLAQGQQELREAQNETNERLHETNERLNIFIDVLERYVSGQHGKS